jgi:Uma2 family endonuclease
MGAVDTEGQGEVIVQMPTKLAHQDIVDFLNRLLGLFIQFFGLGKIVSAPYEMKLKPRGSSREPDVLFVATANLSRLTNDRLNGPADLVIEVISEDSVKRDRSDKYANIRMPGVREYWVIDPAMASTRGLLHLDDTSQYQFLHGRG